MKKEEIEKIKKSNEELIQIKDVIARSYSDASDDFEENIYQMKKLLDSGRLDQNESDFFCERVMSTKKRILEFESLKTDEIRKVDRIISDNEEGIKALDSEEENEDSSETEK